MRFVGIVDRLARIACGLLVVAALAFALFLAARRGPQDLPWIPLDLGQPVGLATAGKLAALTNDAPRCRALLDRAGVAYTVLPPRAGGPSCGYDDGVRLTGGAQAIAYRPTGLGTSCAVSAALVLWEWQVVQPAALRHLGLPVATIDHFGSYACRRIYGRAEGSAWSEHATADAVDIAGFRLEDGTRITVAADWNGDPRHAAFLRAVRDGACRLFATTLSPDYNRAHHDHLHLDMAQRGRVGWTVCR